MLFAFIAIIVATLLITGALVYTRNPKDEVNKHFALFTLFLGVWTMANFIGANYKNYEFSKFFITADFLMGPIMVFTFWQFTNSLSKNVRKHKKGLNLKKVLLTAALVATLSIFSGQVFSLSLDSYTVVINYGNLYLPYSLVLGLITLASIVELVKARLHAERVLIQQLNLMFIGIGVGILLFSTANLILPQISNDPDVNLRAGNLSYVGVVVFVVLTGYAIVRHKLFDIRLVVARSIAYVFSIGLLLAIYSLISSAITDYFNDTAGLIVNAVVVAVAILSYPVLKVFFDRFTNQIFYRDAYDPQVFLDELNKNVVSNIELGILLRKTAGVIEKYLKSSFCLVGVSQGETSAMKMIGTDNIHPDKEDMGYIRAKLSAMEKKVIVTDNITNHEQKLKQILSKNDISVIVSLKASSDSGKAPIAYLMLGPKKSGNIYNKADLRIIQIIADELVIAIQNALRFEEIQGFAAKLQAEVNTATSKLQRTNKKLKELDETKDEFISMASHQLRTPLTSVKGYMSMVLEGDAGKISKQQRDLLNQAFVSSQRMVYLIADLLNVSRLKTGKFIIESTPTNLAEVIEGEIDQLRETAKAKKIDIEYEKPKDFPTLALDETKIRQVIMNFSDNAIYYTQRGGKVKVELSEDKSYVYFKVTDNGLGIPKRDIPHMFTKFYRASNARKARPDGTGLGLFMAKKVIDAQGGSILFESEENKGSMFGFCFDKKKHKVKNTPLR